MSAQQLIEALLRWSLAAVTGSPGGQGAVITAGQLLLLAEQLTLPGTADGPFGLADLGVFFTTNLHWEISGDPTAAPGGTATQAQPFDGTAVPVPPFLNWTSPQIGDIDLATHNPVGPLYTWGAAGYAAQFSPAQRPDTPPPPDDPAAYEPFAAYPFRDWALMVARTAVQAAQDAMAAWDIQVTGPVSLSGIAASFASAATDYVVRAADTMDSVAAALGAGRDELAYLNPDLPEQLARAEAGAVLRILLGVAPQAVAADNAQVPVIAATLPLGTVDYQVSETDTLQGIARRFTLPGPADLFADQQRALAEDPTLLKPHAGFDVPEQIRPWTAGRELAAATYFVHYQVPVAVDYAAWYMQTVFDLNSTLIEGGAAAIIPEGTTLQVPRELYGADTQAYVSAPGDTVALIGTILSLSQNFGTGQAGPQGWPAFRDAVRLGQGTVTIPAARIDTQPGESVSRLGLRTIVYANDVAGLLTWIGGAPILAPLFIFPVPGVALACQAGTTLANLAAYTGLALDELARRVADVPLFAGTKDHPLQLRVTHLPVQDIDDLVDAVLDSDAAAHVAGNSCRQLMSGLRLPEPETGPDGHTTATGPLSPLYTLTGQMASGPAPDSSRPQETGLEVKVHVDAGAASWIRLIGSAVVEAGHSAEELAARLPELARLNPALAAAPERIRPGLIIRTAETDELVFTYTNLQLAEHYPDPDEPLLVQPVAGPSPLPLADVVPTTYGADRRIALQTPQPLPIPAEGSEALTGISSAWPLPEALLALAHTGSATPYEIVRAAPPGTDAPADIVPGTTFATLISFGIRQIPDRPHVYELLGADTTDRALALSLYRYLTAPDTPAGTVAYLAAAPAPDASDTSGRAVLQADPAATFVIRANQSTQSVPPAAASRLGAASQPATGGYADLADLAGFCLLLWQGSIAAGVGYHFGFGAAGGTDLPAGIFDQTGTAQLSLLVIAGARMAPAPQGRTLLPIDTCVLVGPWLDPAATALFLQAADDSQTSVQPGTAPGVAGFQLTLPNPEQDQSTQGRLRRLFSLLTYHQDPPTDAHDGFELPESGLPAGPQEDDGQQLTLWQREHHDRRARAGRLPQDPAAQTSALWKYSQTLPVSRFAPASPAPDVPALPAAAADPYRGIEGEKLPEIPMRLGFCDILGNLTTPTASGDRDLVPVPVGYADALLGVAGWPAVTLSWGLRPASQNSGQVQLAVTLTPQPAATAPGLDPGPAQDAAERQAERYAQIYYQLAGDRVEGYLLSTLRQNADGQPEPLPVDTEPLWRFAASAYVAARAASAVMPVTAAGTLAAIGMTYGVGLEEVARANADRPMAQLFGPTVPVVPGYVVVAAGDTADAIAAAPRPGWPRPVSGAALLAMPENQTLPLSPGMVLTTPGREIVAPGGPEPGTLAALAGQAFTTAGLLAQDNAQRSGILTPGFVFQVDGQAVPVPDSRPFTLADVQVAFAELGVATTVASLAQDNAERPGLLAAGARLLSAHYVVGEDDTLQDNRSGFQGQALAETNGGTADLFDAGALVRLGTFGPDRPAPTTGESLESYAARFGCPPALLLAANLDMALPADAVLIPGAVSIPQGEQRPKVPYTIAAADTLDTVASRFAASAEQIAGANAALPGTLTPDRPVVVVVDGTTVSARTQAGDSFTVLHARLAAQDPRVTFSDVVLAIATSPDVLAVDALLLCPAAVLPGAPGSVMRPDEVAAAYHLDAVLIAQANLGTLGLIAPGARLVDPGGQVEVVTGPADTFNTLTARFAQAGAAIDAAAIVIANRTRPMLAGGAALLLPAAPVTVSASLGQDVPTFAAPVFPLSVTLRVQRPKDLIVTECRTPLQDGPVERGDCVVPAPAQAQGRSDAATLTLAAFAAQFHEALPGLRLGTSRAPADAGSARGQEAGEAGMQTAGKTQPDLWVVDFRREGITSVQVAPKVLMPDGSLAPRCFALRPLYNDLVTRLGVGVRALLPDGTLAPEAVPTDFQGVDAEVLARRVLSDVDLFLSAAYAAGVYADPDARGALGTVLAAKQSLAPAVARGLATVLDVQDPSAAAGLEDAVETLRQELAVNLSRAYDTAAVVQYNASVDSPWTRGTALPAARLYGTAQPAGAAQGLPYTLTAAKTSLDESASTVTFLMRVPDPAHHGAVAVDLDYGILDLEFGIRPVQGVAGYEQSAWLAFFPPLVGAAKPPALRTSLGQARVPIPLRAYPATPSLLGQSAQPSKPGPPPDLTATRLWTYALTYAHEHAEQDEVQVTARFNVPAESRATAAPVEDVATAMARYSAVADGLWALLSYYATADAAVPAAVAANAAHTFAGFVAIIAGLWDAHWRPDGGGGQDAARAAAPSGAQGRGPAPQSYDFRVRVGYATDPDGVVLLDTVTLGSADGQPVPVGTWPLVACRAPGGATVWLEPDSPGEFSRVYRVPAADRIPAGDPPTVTLQWPDLPADRFQNARAELSVRRNQRLLGPEGPATHEDFVYRTPLTQAPAAVAPLLSWADPIDITSLGDTLDAALVTAFAQLSPPGTDLPATLSLQYGYPLVPATDPRDELTAYVPVALAPAVTLEAASAARIAAQAADWLRRNDPPSGPGRSWALSLSVHSQLDPSASRPLLSFNRLVFRIRD
jgi:LysM repeat protein